MVDGLNTQTQLPDELFAGGFPRAMSVALISGAAALTKGTVLGRTVSGGAAVGAVKAGNTGNGTLTGVVTAAGHQPGIYTIQCIEPAANGGVWRVEDPLGNFV